MNCPGTKYGMSDYFKFVTCVLKYVLFLEESVCLDEGGILINLLGHLDIHFLLSLQGLPRLV